MINILNLQIAKIIPIRQIKIGGKLRGLKLTCKFSYISSGGKTHPGLSSYPAYPSSEDGTVYPLIRHVRVLKFKHPKSKDSSQGLPTVSPESECKSSCRPEATPHRREARWRPLQCRCRRLGACSNRPHRSTRYCNAFSTRE